ncbi:importin-5 [Planococcus citri]|uniref:importin-5 n=1 Tax=Planococcus citri TaxID=170843 RepID=UPI0031F9B8A4
MALDATNFRQVLSCLLSLEADTRNKAEEAFNNIPTETRILFLLNSITDESLPDGEKQLACVLMRRLITNDFPEFYPKLSAEDQDQLKKCLLLLVQAETNDGLKKKMCDIVSELARNLVDDDGNNQWPEFLQFLFRCASSTSAQMKECSLRMFANVPGVFGNQQNSNLNLIKQMLQQSLVDGSDSKVRAQAVRAVCSFIILHEKETAIQKHFQDLLPSIIQVLAENLQNWDDDSIIKSFIDLCESSPKFLRPHIGGVIELCLKVFSNEDIDDEVRHLALEVIVTLSEVGSAMMKKEAQNYVGPLVQSILKMMADLEEDQEWSCSDEIVDEDNENNNVVAESSIDRLACGLGGKIVLPHIISNIPAMLSNSDWRFRHAALMAISAVGEGCHKQMEPLLPQIIEGVLTFLQDQHPRVRYAACNAVGQMSSDFAPTLQKKFHDKIVPSLLLLLDDNLNPRVQAHAGAALVNFAEDCPKHILVQYLEGMMLKLEAILNAKFTELVEKGTKLVLEQVVTTIASVADTAEEQFVAFYDRLIPKLKYIIDNAVTAELRQLRGKTLECVSLIGLAVGHDKFAKDARDVMDTLLKNHENGDIIAEDDPYHTYLISAWARICIVLGKDFQPYLPLVIGPVMKTASMKPEVALFDNEDLEDLDRVNADWQFISLGEQQNFGIRTAGLEDKVAACEMLVCYARELKEGFADYAEETVRLMIPLLKFYFHDGVRMAAAQSLPHLLECVKIKGPDYVKDMWNFICPELLSAIKGDPENEVVGDLFHSMAKCIEVLGKGCLTEQWMNELISLFEKNLLEHFLEQEAVQEKRKEEDYDENLEDEVDDSDEADTTFKISKLADVVHALFKVYGTDFYPYFDRVLTLFVKMLDPRQKWTDHQWSICIFDDLIEFTGPHCKKYKDYFLAPLANYVTYQQPEVRQAACYGFGVLALYGGEEFAQTCASVIPDLCKIISDPSAREEENQVATENAISALTKILKYNSSAVNVDEVLPHWLQSLPVTEDADEVPHVYDYLCDLIERNHPIVLGNNNSNLPNLVAIMTEVFFKDAIKLDHIVAKRMITIMREVQKSPEMFELCLSQLSIEKRAKLTEILVSG